MAFSIGYLRVPVCLNHICHHAILHIRHRVPTGTRVFKPRKPKWIMENSKRVPTGTRVFKPCRQILDRCHNRGYLRVPVCLNFRKYAVVPFYTHRVPTGTRVFKRAQVSNLYQHCHAGYLRVPVCLNGVHQRTCACIIRVPTGTRVFKPCRQILDRCHNRGYLRVPVCLNGVHQRTCACIIRVPTGTRVFKRELVCRCND